MKTVTAGAKYNMKKVGLDANGFFYNNRFIIGPIGTTHCYFKMCIRDRAMEIEYIHIKRFNLEIEKAYAIGLTAIHIHSLPYYWKNL